MCQRSIATLVLHPPQIKTCPQDDFTDSLDSNNVDSQRHWMSYIPGTIPDSMSPELSLTLNRSQGQNPMVSFHPVIFVTTAPATLATPYPQFVPSDVLGTENDHDESSTPNLIYANYAAFPHLAAGTLVDLKWVAFFGAAMAVFPAFFSLNSFQ
ncbi:hypothetical protein DFJ58DRAFT_738020 [Suillus subalutaceus]|uniref:uncharacterized protein n=1 Tax=Suillus subalutaceus TaxID=48586 RepID=UPI001B8870BE|nr:uncharacterized protein DFJ58DRAFT_738020 [Suillus subalutaceus]KAG1828051.1 hypothetical protein DFJ58DRAFT_738020 [Suillus subalutaceus]